MKYSLKKATEIAKKLKVNWNKVKFTPQAFQKGLNEEGVEHRDVTKGNDLTAGKLVLPHLKKMPDYYEKLEKMESEK